MIAKTDNVQAYGSFQDSLRAPIHRWFQYPAGYSHKLVECKIDQYALGGRHWIVDPFVGSGTTSLAAKTSGVNSIGVEAHPFVFWVANTKLHFEQDTVILREEATMVQERAMAIYADGVQCDNIWPDLIYKCFDQENLCRLYALRTAIESLPPDDVSISHRDFFKLALTATLRDVTSAGAGWPYIAPSKYGERTVQRNAFNEFEKRCLLMVSDLLSVQASVEGETDHLLFNRDARDLGKYVPAGSVDVILTSPPYLNNYDYADRTRMETYFWGLYDSWGEITRDVRDHLIIAATTQIRRTDMEDVRECPGVESVSPRVHRELMSTIQELSALRLVKNGRKGYDLLVAGYFEDMLKVIMEAFQVLKQGGRFILVLGDSAPYGVHVRTDELIGELAVEVGFSEFAIEFLRTRGDKWNTNSQRHKVKLRESIVTITK